MVGIDRNKIVRIAARDESSIGDKSNPGIAKLFLQYRRGLELRANDGDFASELPAAKFGQQHVDAALRCGNAVINDRNRLAGRIGAAFCAG